MTTNLTFLPFTVLASDLANIAYELSVFHGCEIYIALDTSSGMTVYNSVLGGSWPPPRSYENSRSYHVHQLNDQNISSTRISMEDYKNIILFLRFNSGLIELWERRLLEYD
ncbi:uncharacterized protein BDV14DRAFT_182319 [Aspergillus stella-maris]|uniref:uncharacterized protein n=1 Tax=Aspergillus stella-maris TaxID=1810926 RepID=UPI003CCDC9C1